MYIQRRMASDAAYSECTMSSVGRGVVEISRLKGYGNCIDAVRTIILVQESPTMNPIRKMLTNPYVIIYKVPLIYNTHGVYVYYVIYIPIPRADLVKNIT